MKSQVLSWLVTRQIAYFKLMTIRRNRLSLLPKSLPACTCDCFIFSSFTSRYSEGFSGIWIHWLGPWSAMLLFSNVRKFPTVPIQLWLGAVVSVVSSIYRSAYMGAKKVLNLVMLIMGAQPTWWNTTTRSGHDVDKTPYYKRVILPCGC